MERVERLFYRILASILLPRRQRRLMGGDLMHTFDAVLEDARRVGSRNVTRVYLGELRELFRGAFQLRFGVFRAQRAPQRQFDTITTNTGSNIMEGWLREIRLAVRSMVKRPGFATLAIVTLALGIGANTAIFSVIQGSLLAQLPFADPDRLVWLSDGHEDLSPVGVDQSIPNLMDLRDGSRLSESVAFYTFANANLATEESPDRVRMLMVSSEWLSVLGTPPQIGRDLAPEDDVAGAPRVALLTDEIWRTRFGADPNIVGRDLSIDSEPVSVAGIAPPEFRFPGDPQIIVPLQHVGGDYSRGWRNFNAVGRLAEGAEVDVLSAELQSIFERLVEEYPDQNAGWSTGAMPLRTMMAGRNTQSLFLLAGGVGLVLLIACVNVANLLIVRAENRHRELAVRYAMGARRAELLSHFLAEGLVLSIAGGVLGIAGAYWGVDLLVALYGATLPRADQIGLNGAVMGFALVVSLVVGLVVGLIPLIRLRPDQLQDSLKEGARGASAQGSRLGQILVMAEVALAVLIVAAAGLLTNSLWHMQQVELGVSDIDRVLTFNISLPQAKYADAASINEFYDRLTVEIEPVPGVEAVGLVNRLPLLGGSNLTNFPVYGDPERVSHFVSVRAVSPGYFDAIGVPLLAGRWLNASEFADSAIGSILINETLARELFQGGDPLGQLVGPDWTQGGFLVVGVVGDIMGGNPTRPAPPAYYFPMALGPELFRSVVVKATGDPLSVLPTLRQIVRRMDPEVPIFQVRTLEEIARSRMGMGRFAQSLFGVFAALALLLGAVGIYGVMSFAVSRRAREFGVRLALGASRGSVLLLVLRQGMRLTVPGVFVGVVAALASARLMESILFEVSPLDPLTYVAVALVLGLVSLGASYLPAYQATRLDPITSLREE
ncbi:ABC transporter permease [Gemmatimonadota bacterium]